MDWCCFSSKAKNDLSQFQESLSSWSPTKNVKIFTYEDIRAATGNLHPSRKLGQGGFGTVYKGTLKDGEVIAAKVLSAESKQGSKQFLTEINMIANVQHPNLVQLIGCCVNGGNRILVYEYVENNSLDKALRGLKDESVKLSWEVRSSICIGTAKGLAFLHGELEPPIVHRDIKASNILLDKDMNPKIGDFGLARLFPQDITHISTQIAGTTGYMAPEYVVRGQLTKKADVYSFGVVALEVISGRSIFEPCWYEMETYLVKWAWELFEEDKLMELVDQSLENYPMEDVLKFIKVALFCTQMITRRRPSMAQVVTMLSTPIRLNDKELKPPNFSESRYATSTWDAKRSTNVDWPFIDVGNTAGSASVTYSDVLPR